MCHDNIFIEFHGFKFLDSLSKWLNSLFIKKYSSLSIYYCFSCSSFSICYHRNPESHSLYRDKSEVLERREEKPSCSCKKYIFLVLRDTEFPSDIGFGFSFEFSEKCRISIRHQYEIFSIFIESIDKEIEFFVRNTTTNEDNSSLTPRSPLLQRGEVVLGTSSPLGEGGGEVFQDR